MTSVGTNLVTPGTRTLVLVVLLLVNVEIGTSSVVVDVESVTVSPRDERPTSDVLRHPMTSVIMKLTRVRVLLKVEFTTKMANMWFRILGRWVTVFAVFRVDRLTVRLVLTILRLQLTIFMTFFPLRALHPM